MIRFTLILKTVFTMVSMCLGISLSSPTFEKASGFQGYLCPYIRYNFGQVERPIPCAIVCDRQTDCFGYFHSVTSSSCFGINYVLSSLSGCSANSEYKFYRKTDIPTTTSTTTTTTTTTTPTTSTTTTTTTTPPPTLYGTPCTVNTDCSQANTGCVTGTCQCVGGYKLQPSTSTCVTYCDVYGSSYLEFPGIALLVSSLSSFNNLDAAQCQDECNKEPSCQSYNFVTSGSCYLKASTEHDDPTSMTTMSDCTHYVRNCDSV